MTDLLLDIEGALAVWLTTTLPDVRVVTEVPANLQDVLPLIRVMRIGGGDPMLLLDRATVDVDVFDAGRIPTRLLGERVRAALRSTLPGSLIDGGAVSRVGTINAPAWRPWDDTTVRRFGATYEITAHTIPS